MIMVAKMYYLPMSVVVIDCPPTFAWNVLEFLCSVANAISPLWRADLSFGTILIVSSSGASWSLTVRTFRADVHSKANIFTSS